MSTMRQRPGPSANGGRIRGRRGTVGMAKKGSSHEALRRDVVRNVSRVRGEPKNESAFNFEPRALMFVRKREQISSSVVAWSCPGSYPAARWGDRLFTRSGVISFYKGKSLIVRYGPIGFSLAVHRRPGRSLGPTTRGANRPDVHWLKKWFRPK